MTLDNMIKTIYELQISLLFLSEFHTPIKHIKNPQSSSTLVNKQSLYRKVDISL